MEDSLSDRNHTWSVGQGHSRRKFCLTGLSDRNHTWSVGRVYDNCREIKKVSVIVIIPDQLDSLKNHRTMENIVSVIVIIPDQLDLSNVPLVQIPKGLSDRNHTWSVGQPTVENPSDSLCLSDRNHTWSVGLDRSFKNANSS